MTMQEKTGVRELNMSKWIRENLPDSNLGFMVTDLDFILYNYNTKNIMLIEIKTRNKKLPYWQENIFKNLAKWIKDGIDKDWTFLGFNVIKFENTFFTDGKCYINEIEITEKDLRIFLSKI